MRIAIVSSGLGRVHRGFERFALELGNNLAKRHHVDIYGTGKVSPDSNVRVVHAVNRDASLLRRRPLSRRSAHYWETLTFSAALIPHLMLGKYHVVHVVDPPVMNFLVRFRKALGGKWQVVFSNGVGLSSDLCARADHVHEVSPHPFEVALHHGIHPSKMTLLPHAVDCAALNIAETKEEARRKLRLPVTATIALHVSSLNRDHKRTDHAIREVGTSRDMVLLAIGRVADASLVAEGKAILGNRFIHRELPFKEMSLAYKASDLFVHTALFEGFGLSLVEAMAASLPIFAHDDRHFRWLLKHPEGLLPMNVKGALAAALQAFEKGDRQAQAVVRRKRHAFETYSWEVLAPQYEEMYMRVNSKNTP